MSVANFAKSSGVVLASITIFVASIFIYIAPFFTVYFGISDNDKNNNNETLTTNPLRLITAIGTILAAIIYIFLLAGGPVDFPLFFALFWITTIVLLLITSISNISRHSAIEYNTLNKDTLMNKGVYIAMCVMYVLSIGHYFNLNQSSSY